MSIGRTVVTLAFLAVLSGCTAEEERSTAEEQGGIAPVAACEDAVAQVADPGETYQIAAGVVAVPESGRLLEPAENTSGAGPTRLFAKWGLLVRTGATVELALLPGWDDRARIRWGDTGIDPATTVTVVACGAEAGQEPWSVFTGGTWVIEPDCVPIRITTPAEQVTVELSIGTPCSRPGG